MSLSSFNPQGPAEVFPGQLMVPTGGLVHYVHSSGAAGLSLLPPGMASPSPGGFFTSVATAHGSCRASRGDRIVCLPGHVEAVSSADYFANWVAGVEVIGTGSGADRATFTWTTAASTILMDQASIAIRNCNLFLAGAHAAGTALTVAAPITMSASSAEITGCNVWWGFDADQIVGIGITTTAAADNLKFNDNNCFAETAAVPTTTFLRLTGADQMEMNNTFIIGPGSTVAIGPVQQLTTAGLKSKITNSYFQNTLAASTHAFTAIAGCTGIVHNCGFGVLAAGNGLTTGSGLQVTNSWTAVAGAAGVATTG